MSNLNIPNNINPQPQPIPSQQPVYNPFASYRNAPPQQYYQMAPMSRKMLNDLRNKEASELIPLKEGRAWSSMVLRPNMAFANQNPDERVYILVRKHWITNIGWAFRNFVYSVLPIISFFVIINFNIDISFVSLRALFLGILIYYSIIFTNVIRQFVDWYFDPFIVTNERILDYDFKPFGTYYVAEMDLEDIEDIKESSSGILGQIFNYGSILVLSANTRTEIDFKHIPDPTRIRDIITDLSKIAKTYRYGDI